MPEQAAFLARQVRRVLGITQAQAAERFGVEQCTYSRWERGRQRPPLDVVRLFEEITAFREPALCTRFLVASPLPKMMTDLRDFSNHVAYSAGAGRMVRAAGGRLDEWGHSDFVSPMAAVLNNRIASDPRWVSGEILFLDIKMANQFGPNSEVVPVHVVAAPIHKMRLALFEGGPAPLDEPPRIKLYLADTRTETILLE